MSTIYHYDCGTVLDFDGTWDGARDPLKDKGVLCLLYITAFSTAALSFLLFPEEDQPCFGGPQKGPVFTARFYKDSLEKAKGLTEQEYHKSFVWSRVFVAWIVLQRKEEAKSVSIALH